jgi:hypothetical protein
MDDREEELDIGVVLHRNSLLRGGILSAKQRKMRCEIMWKVLEKISKEQSEKVNSSWEVKQL